MKFKKGDRVEVLSPAEEKGMQGHIIALNDAECVVRITKAGEGHNTTKLIGRHLPYFHTDLKGI
jgi:ribosomal protein L24